MKDIYKRSIGGGEVKYIKKTKYVATNKFVIIVAVAVAAVGTALGIALNNAVAPSAIEKNAQTLAIEIEKDHTFGIGSGEDYKWSYDHNALAKEIISKVYSYPEESRKIAWDMVLGEYYLAMENKDYNWPFLCDALILESKKDNTIILPNNFDNDPFIVFAGRSGFFKSNENGELVGDVDRFFKEIGEKTNGR